jgi:hypothetical protein
MKCKLMLSTLLVLFLAIVPNALASSSWYVDGVHGNDGNDCRSPQHACKTIGHAITLASSGDSILVASATYSENLTIGVSLNVTGYGASAVGPSVALPIVIDGGARNTVVTISNTGAQVTLSNLTIQNGLGQINGGGVNNAGALTIFNSTIVANTTGVNGNGGGINNTGTLTMNNSNVLYNSAGNGGGGIAGPGALTINNSTVSGNSGASGGGIYGAGTLTVSNSAIWSNSASNGGGIGDAGLGGTATIVNSTIYGNSASNGGGIYNTSRTLSVSNGSFGLNSGFVGANFYNTGPTAAFKNSIVGSPTSGPNCSGAITSNGYNLSSDDTCSFHSTGDLINTDPMLAYIHNNGGPTWTMAEETGSPAMNAGNPSGCTNVSGQLLTTDQRGYPRPGRGKIRCDMGAYEFQNN